jgi:hypothetical protein
MLLENKIIKQGFLLFMFDLMCLQVSITRYRSDDGFILFDGYTTRSEISHNGSRYDPYF